MSSASYKLVDECVRFSMSIAPYVDGELDAGHAVDVEGHVASCTECQERVALTRAVRTSLRRTATRQAPPLLRSAGARRHGAESERAGRLP